jgi:hypothetical protein
MKGTDILLTFLIILIFTILFSANILSVGIEKIKKEWPKYRCNPVVMPIANVFGEDTMKNFAFCVQNLQSTFMQDLLQPVHYAEKLMSSVTKEFTDAINSIRAFFNKIRNMIMNIIKEIMGVFLNLLIGFQHMIISIRDLFQKTIGTLTVFLYLMEGGIMAMKSGWEGPPGQMVRFMCFHPDTLVKLQDGTIKPISVIDPGDILKNSQTVHGTMKLHNLDTNGNYIEKLYRFKGEKDHNDNDTSILVSGSHLIYDKEIKNFVNVKNHKDAKLTNIDTKTLICLITSDHTIPLGNYIFHDWEDNQGSPSKNV